MDEFPQGEFHISYVVTLAYRNEGLLTSALILTAKGAHIIWTSFLEQQFQRIYIIKLYSGNTASESFRHRLVATNVQVLYVVKLCVGRSFNVEMEFFGFIAVHLKHRDRLCNPYVKIVSLNICSKILNFHLCQLGF